MQSLSGKALLIAHFAFPRINEENLKAVNASRESRELWAAIYVDAPGLTLAHWMPSAYDALENFDQTWVKSLKFFFNDDRFYEDEESCRVTICKTTTRLTDNDDDDDDAQNLTEIIVYFFLFYWMERKLLPKCRNLWKPPKKTPQKCKKLSVFIALKMKKILQ